MMYILFTRGKNPISSLICAVTGEPVSHCAILWGSLVFHSNILGLRIESLADFLDHSEIKYRIAIPDNASTRFKLTTLLNNKKRSLYDFGAFIFLGLSLFLRSKLRIPLPKSNLWKASGMYLCTEFISDILYSREYSMLTPMGLYNLILNKETQE
jgi:hypothetical protein